jgi:predicted nucleotidyltransferase
MLTHEEICTAVAKIAKNYPITKVSYFGSYADGNATEDSDLDLLVEFDLPWVSLFMLSEIKIEFEELLNISVDIIRSPFKKDPFFKIANEVNAYG